MKNLRLLTTAVALALLCTALQAQSTRNAGSAGGQFLKIGVGARAMGMAGAYSSFSGDAASLAWNPAGIGTMDAINLSVQHTAWIADINHDFIGLVAPISEQVNVGFHTVYLTSGDIEITTIDNPEGTGQYYDVSNIAVGLTSSVRLTTHLTFATTVKYVEENMHDMKSSGLAFDAGAWYSTGFRSLNLGFSVSNLGFDQKFSGRSLEVRYQPPAPGEPTAKSELQTLTFSLPLMFRASGSFDLFEMFDEPLDGHRLLTALDFVQNSDTPERLVLGAEYTWQSMISLRSGYLFNADELSWSAGGGVNLGISDFRVSVDYAASSLGRFGIGHRFGVAVGY